MVRRFAYVLTWWMLCLVLIAKVLALMESFSETPDLEYWKWLQIPSFLVTAIVWIVFSSLKRWINATEHNCEIDPYRQKLTMVRRMPASVALVDRDWNIIECSKVFADAVGASNALQLVGWPVYDLYKDRDLHDSFLRNLRNDLSHRPVWLVGFDQQEKYGYLGVTVLDGEYLVSFDRVKGKVS